jgi:hypothetical protein
MKSKAFKDEKMNSAVYFPLVESQWQLFGGQSL